jgi:hypothetical protein
VHFTVRPVQNLSACTTVHFTVRPVQNLSACTRVHFNFFNYRVEKYFLSSVEDR